jgi:3-hydroxybutyryl-CoA dehydrogenase
VGQPNLTERLGIAGSGAIARGLARVAAGHGEVVLWARRPESAEVARAELGDNGARVTTDLAELGQCSYVVEAVVEDVAVKRDVFAQLDRLCPPHAILATNSSTIVSSRLADATRRPDRVANMHYFNPALVMQVVEVVQGPHTAPDTAARLVEFCQATRKRPIWMKREIDGFIANRLLGAVIREAGRLVDEGYATFEDVDLAAEKALGHPMGPFRLLDFTGLDVSYLVGQDRFRRTGKEEDRPPRCVEERVRAGRLGRKSGRGFYEYSRES